MERHWDEELKLVKTKLLEMAAAVELSIQNSIKGLVERNEALAKGALEADHQVDDLELEIEDLCLKLLALHQPMAVDLRFLAAAMKISNDLERMGDQAVNIAERAITLMGKAQLKPLTNIPKMATATQGMVKDSMDAFVRGDARLAKSVCERDNIVDDLNDKVFRSLLAYMQEGSDTIERAVDLLLVARHLERIADHATNVAEEVIYIVDGRVIKHHHQEQHN